MKSRWPVVVSIVGLAGILALRAASCAKASPAAGVLIAGSVGFTPQADGTLVVRTGSYKRDLKLAVEVDGLVAPLDFGTGDDGGFGAGAWVEIEGERYEAHVKLSPDETTSSLSIALEVPAQGSGEHEIALRVQGPDGRVAVFAQGVGELGDVGAVDARAVVLEDEHPMAVTARDGLVAMAESGSWYHEDGGIPLRFVARTHGIRTTVGGRAELRVVVGDTSTGIWSQIWSSLGEPAERVTGIVTGAKGSASVIGLDADGRPQIRFTTDAGGRFEVRAPRSIVRWYAGQAVTRTSAPALFVPGSPEDLVLDLSEGGELVVHVLDFDTRLPLTARLFVHGIDGTLDPSFGPDYRASGAGPLIDALRGEVSTPLPSGHYRVSATKGIEWSIDARDIEILPDEQVEITLAPRHVVPTPGQVACDFHVHARPSFDSPVTPDDRVLSLVAAGIDFAVPSEHNIVGDYGPAIRALDVGKEFAFVPGVEVTTYKPFIGHFGVYPYPAQLGVPPYKGTSADKIFAAARRGNDPKRVIQVNHPRMGKRIGYFDFIGWQRDGGAPPASLQKSFDAIELMNGYDLATPEKIDLVLHDWFVLLSLGHKFVVTGSSDSHRIQYTWAGYPRTLVQTADDPVDPNALTLDLKRGHAIVTSGPILDFDVDGAKPGDEIAHASTVSAHVRVRAAPWIDVSTVELWEGSGPPARFMRAASIPVISRPTRVGQEAGSLDEARARTVRLETTQSIEVGEGATWIVAVARGTRRMDDVLPFMPVVPMAVTNPVWVKGR
jgi:hypothetical protein